MIASFSLDQSPHHQSASFAGLRINLISILDPGQVKCSREQGDVEIQGEALRTDDSLVGGERQGSMGVVSEPAGAFWSPVAQF